MSAQVGLVPEEASKTEQMLRYASINLVKGGPVADFGKDLKPSSDVKLG